MLEIHNSLSGKKEAFKPINPPAVGLYVCGMTVYDLCHLGHARAMVVFDAVVRYLRASGYQVHYVRNITDVDDKIITRAAELGEPIEAITKRFTAAMHEDADALGCLRPDDEPRATGHMAEIIVMIERLIERGYAYVSEGDVYFAVNAFPNYGALSGKRLDELRAGARVQPEKRKRDPADFALWKAADVDGPTWPSPWGKGRPGWHIECSAMSTQCLGKHFDIHGGGLDLKFPHHENEIAQSEAATGESFVNVWMHNGHVRIDDEKMAKSLGNFTTIRDILSQHDAETVRYFLLSSHYRSPLNYSTTALANARAALERLYLALRETSVTGEFTTSEFSPRFYAAMDDDFNTPVALAVLFDVARAINRALASNDLAKANALAQEARHLGAILGLLGDDADSFLQGEVGQDDADAARIETQIQARNAARDEKDFAKADAIRDELLTQGIVLEDNADGTRWRREG